MHKKNMFKMVSIIYIGSILVGTIVLKFPFFHDEGVSVSLLEALFTSTSALTTTGLNIINIAETFNVLGYFVLILMFNLGALGIIVMWMIIWRAMGKRLGYESRVMMQVDHNKNGLSDMVTIVKYIIKVYLFIELITTILIFPVLAQNYDTLFQAFYESLFLVSASISGSGFTITDTSAYFENQYIMIILAFLMFVGGIGFPVIIEIREWIKVKFKNKNYKFSIFTRVVVKMSIIMYIITFFLIIIFEKNNEAFVGVSFIDKISNVLFLTFSAKSIGLTTISDITILNPETLILLITIMLIGGSPSSSSGGIRLTTVYIIYLHFKSMIAGKEKVRYNRYFIKNISVLKAYAVTFSYFLLISFGSMLMYKIDGSYSIGYYVFDFISAITTTGFTVGTTAGTVPLNQLILIFAMIIGRIGIIGILYSFATRNKSNDLDVKYIEKDLEI